LRAILLNPGPVTLSRRVREAMLRADLCHREPRVRGVARRTAPQARRRLRPRSRELGRGAAHRIRHCRGRSDAREVPTSGRVLIIESGVYGERMTRIGVSGGWGEAIDLLAAERAIRRGAFSRLAVVHHETTTGRLNDIARLGELAAAHGARLLLDGVSSFGGEALEFDGWHLDACAATANKCLHCVPGTAFVLVRRAALAAAPTRTVYLDLATYLAQQELGHLTIRAGRQVLSTLSRIDRAFSTGEWAARALWPVLAAHERLDLVGLLSDAGVHGHWRSMVQAATPAGRCGVKSVVVHPILDGVDSAQGTAPALLAELIEALQRLPGVSIQYSRKPIDDDRCHATSLDGPQPLEAIEVIRRALSNGYEKKVTFGECRNGGMSCHRRR